jgi:hypothetical protein
MTLTAPRCGSRSWSPRALVNLAMSPLRSSPVAMARLVHSSTRMKGPNWLAVWTLTILRLRRDARRRSAMSCERCEGNTCGELLWPGCISQPIRLPGRSHVEPPTSTPAARQSCRPGACLTRCCGAATEPGDGCPWRVTGGCTRRPSQDSPRGACGETGTAPAVEAGAVRLLLWVLSLAGCEGSAPGCPSPARLARRRQRRPRTRSGSP